MELIGKNKHVECYFDNQQKIVHLTFTGMVNVDLTKEITAKIIDFTKTNVVLGSFVNLSEMTGTFTKLNEHLINEYFPAMIKQGLLCEGVVVSKDVFTKFAADSLIQKMGNFTMQTFQDKEQAYNWVVKNVKSKNYGTAL
jgi:hypothetical protein